MPASPIGTPPTARVAADRIDESEGTVSIELKQEPILRITSDDDTARGTLDAAMGLLLTEQHART
jgi:hypothetical protein